MKLLRCGPPGKERPALLDDAGQLRDLSAIVPDIGPAQLSDTALARLRRLKPSALPLVRGRPRLGCPVAGIGKFIAIGLNYADHAADYLHDQPVSTDGQRSYVRYEPIGCVLAVMPWNFPIWQV